MIFVQFLVVVDSCENSQVIFNNPKYLQTKDYVQIPTRLTTNFTSFFFSLLRPKHFLVEQSYD